MNDTVWAIVIILIAVVAFVALWTTTQRSRQLRTHFGQEYDRTVEHYGEKRTAERALLDRTERVKRLQIRPLPPNIRKELAIRWEEAQSRFVDDPAGALNDAHALLLQGMREEGYPTGRIEEQVELLSVHHPSVVQHYRAAHRLAQSREQGVGATEDLRQAMIHYRVLFQDLLELGAPRGERAPEVRS
jgi:hypothetical protein